MLDQFWLRLQSIPSLVGHQGVVSNLTALLQQWTEAGSEPKGVSTLSGGEYRALALAAGKETLLHSPVIDFLMLDGWLQQWVLHAPGRPSLIGIKVGE